MAESNPKIYNFNPKTDGWKTFHGAETKTIKIDQKQRGIREYEIPLTHYCKGGQTMCGMQEVAGVSFYNDARNQCPVCRGGVRDQTKQAIKNLNDARAGKISKDKAEEINVIDYKAAEAADHPESSKVSH